MAEHEYGECAQAHHMRHVKFGGTNAVANCVVLCWSCHYSVHEGGNYRFGTVVGRRCDFPHFAIPRRRKRRRAGARALPHHRGIVHALSIRQPYVEAILLGLKRCEYRSWATRIIGERFYVYAAGKPGDLRMLSPKARAAIRAPYERGDLPTGVIVGTAVITHCTRRKDGYAWHLGSVKRLKRLLRPVNKAEPAWFRPF